jgi:integration host factor subunit alpha
MTKIDIENKLYDKLGLTKDECYDILEKFLETIKETLAKNEDVNISGFGKFIVKQKRARRGRNPQNGVEMEITARKVLIFRLSKILNGEMNGKE